MSELTRVFSDPTSLKERAQHHKNKIQSRTTKKPGRTHRCPLHFIIRHSTTFIVYELLTVYLYFTHTSPEDFLLWGV